MESIRNNLMKRLLCYAFLLPFTSCGLFVADAKSTADKRDININGQKLYMQYCASCHGVGLEGGLAPSLMDTIWTYGDSDESILRAISVGIETVGMPGFSDSLSVDNQKDILDFIKAGAPLETVDPITDVPSVSDRVHIQTHIENLEEPWAITFVPNSNVLLITEKNGTLIRIEGEKRDKISGIPIVNSKGQGGLFDVAVDPEYESNGWVYLIFADPLGKKSMTKLVRGKISNTDWVEEQVLFQARAEDYSSSKHHYGGRITFDAFGHLYFSIGDRGDKDMAQDINVPNGKIHRINRDGSIPKTNPFLNSPYPSIYAYGNRNPQGLIVHPQTQTLWETEHGPKGGDELNKIEMGKNYGWPVISYGRNYSGTELTPYTAKPGMEQPESQWTPSIAVCGLDIYTGDLFPEWKGRLLAGALRNQTIRLIDVSEDRYQSESILLSGEGRVRDVTTGPDGAIYVALPNKIIRLSPKL